jgi:hypothetical protein
MMGWEGAISTKIQKNHFNERRESGRRVFQKKIINDRGFGPRFKSLTDGTNSTGST